MLNVDFTPPLLMVGALVLAGVVAAFAIVRGDRLSRRRRQVSSRA